MSQALEQDLDKIRRRARMLVRIHGLGFWALIVVGAAFLAAATDYLVRFQDPGVRLIWSTFVAGISGWAAWRFAWPAIQYSPSNLQVARRVERLYPQLQERLSSTIEFLSQSTDDPTAGSVQLRRAVAAEAASLVGEIDMNACLETRSARRVTATGLLVVVLVVIFDVRILVGFG